MSDSEIQRTVGIVTYNILCPNLCTAEIYKFCNKNDRSNSTRLERIVNLLSTKLDNLQIICLQELTVTWYSKLIPLFSQKQYQVQFVAYGIPKQGHMGILIAWPSKL